MVTPAMQLASKIPDIHVQLWGSAILKGTFCTFSSIGIRNLKFLEFFNKKIFLLLFP